MIKQLVIGVVCAGAGFLVRNLIDAYRGPVMDEDAEQNQEIYQALMEDRNSEIRILKGEIKTQRRHVERIREEHQKTLNELIAKNLETIQEIQDKNDKTLDELKEEYRVDEVTAQINRLEEQQAEEILKMRREHEEALKKLREETFMKTWKLAEEKMLPAPLMKRVAEDVEKKTDGVEPPA